MSYASWIDVIRPATVKNRLARKMTLAAIDCTISATCGVWYRGWSRAKARGIAAARHHRRRRERRRRPEFHQRHGRARDQQPHRYPDAEAAGVLQPLAHPQADDVDGRAEPDADEDEDDGIQAARAERLPALAAD